MLPRKGIATCGWASTSWTLRSALHEMLPRKGIATRRASGKRRRPLALGCTRCFPVRGLRPFHIPATQRERRPELHEMLPRKGIATRVASQGPLNLEGPRCTRCFPVRGLRPPNITAPHSPITNFQLHEMLPRKGIATKRSWARLCASCPHGCTRCFPVRGLRRRAWVRPTRENKALHEMLPRKGIATWWPRRKLNTSFFSCTRCFPVRGLRQQ